MYVPILLPTFKAYKQSKEVSSPGVCLASDGIKIAHHLGHTSELQRKAKMKERSCCQQQMTLSSLLSQRNEEDIKICDTATLW